MAIGSRSPTSGLETSTIPAIDLDFPLSSITMDHADVLVAAIDEVGALRLIDATAAR